MPYTSSITVAGDVGDITKYTSPLKLFDYLSTGKVIICSDISVLKDCEVQMTDKVCNLSTTAIF